MLHLLDVRTDASFMLGSYGQVSAAATPQRDVASADVGGGSAQTFRPIQLNTLEGCERELTRCSNGLAWLDHAYHRAVDSCDHWDDIVDQWESQAAEGVHKRSGITATELKGLITMWFLSNEDARQAREAQREAHKTMKKLERFYRSLEKRASNAQSAQKKHLGEGRYGGTG